MLNLKFGGYNGTAGKFKAHINMGLLLSPRRKGRLPQYSKCYSKKVMNLRYSKYSGNQRHNSLVYKPILSWWRNPMAVKPLTLFSLRSFLGTYKFLRQVIPKCAEVLSPLKGAIAGKQSKDKIQWTDELYYYFSEAQSRLITNKMILLSILSDEFWIIIDSSICKWKLHLTFFSTKQRKHQVKWLPYEIKALGIAPTIEIFQLISSLNAMCVS